MNDQWERARRQYKDIEPPEELDFAVAAALKAGEKKRRQRRGLRRSLSAGLAACACFVLLVNASPTFAKAVSNVPVLGELARVVTVDQYTVEDRNHLIDVRLPALEHTGDTELEQRVNTEIQTRIEQVLQEAEDRAREAKEAYMATGGDPNDFMPITISVDYEIKCQNERYLSFVVTKTETLASAYTEYYTYNIDLQAGREITLRDLLGPDYKKIANSVIAAEIDRRSQDPENLYFLQGEGGFTSIADDQLFYLDADGTPVVVFKKYEIAPGYMGVQKFRIPLSGEQNQDYQNR